MQRLITILFLFLSLNLFGQAPQLIRYQGVAQLDGEIIKNQDISIQFSIAEESANGIITYLETHRVTTDDFGFFALSIGDGENPSVDFSTIAWLDSDHFLRIELDPNGGSAYEYIGADQFYSVPYSIYTNEAKYGPQGDAGPAGLQGQKGPMGEKGEQGSPGPIGPQGPQGPIGPSGPSGPQGPTGPTGPAGEAGFSGEVGDSGDTGQQGPSGATGPNGLEGMTGDQGIAGPTGPIGAKGEPGIDGIGPEGPEGPEGPLGSPGPAGPQGPDGPMGPPGVSGQSFPGAAGVQGKLIQELLSEAPIDPIEDRVYLDDGTNRADGEVGFRYWNGTNWIDL